MGKEKRPEKNSFLLHKDQWEPISDLTDEELGQMLRAIFDYQINDVEPERSSPIFAYFKFFKARFSFEEAKYIETSEGNAIRGKLGGLKSAQSRRLKKEANEATASNSSEGKRTLQIEANQADKDNGNDKDNEKDNVLEGEKIENMKSQTPISDQLNSAVTPWRYIKARKSIQAAEAIVKYTLVDTEQTGEAWSLWVQANKQELWDTRDIRGLWASFEWYINNANNNAKKYAAEKAKPKPPYAPEIPKMNPLKSAFD